MSIKSFAFAALLSFLSVVFLPYTAMAQFWADTSGTEPGSVTAFAGFDHFDVKKSYNSDGETIDFFGTSMEWSLRFRGGVEYGFAERELSGRDVNFSGEAGFTALSLKFKQDENSPIEDVSTTGLENIYVGVAADSRLTDKVFARVGLQYYHDVAPDDSDLILTDEQNGFAPYGFASVIPSDGWLFDVYWKCVATLQGKYDSGSVDGPEKTAGGDVSSKFDNGNFQNFRLGGSYRIVQNDRYTLNAGLSFHSTLRSERSFGDFKQEGSNGNIFSVGPNLDLQMANGLNVQLRGAQDEYGQEIGCFSLSGKNFFRPGKDFSLRTSFKF